MYIISKTDNELIIKNPPVYRSATSMVDHLSSIGWRRQSMPLTVIINYKSNDNIALFLQTVNELGKTHRNLAELKVYWNNFLVYSKPMTLNDGYIEAQLGEMLGSNEGQRHEKVFNGTRSFLLWVTRWKK